MTFGKILVANRGEIACRVIRTARDMGYRTVAVYSTADVGARHVALADQAVPIGPAPAQNSYLNFEAILQAVALSGADAVHPGYGFLSENPAFAEACDKAAIVFVGPPAEAIRIMGNKAAAKRVMIAAGVPCVPGYHGAGQSDAVLAAEAERIGYPVMIKAAAGGGGRGMRMVATAAALPAALADARSEAQNAFGSGELILEKAVVRCRHIEIQIFADGHGNVVHLGERDCSIQRRHQKVIEEAPSPAVSTELRAAMGETAVAAARAIGYRGAGTVEFLLDDSGRFYFLEMNTRIQVEHPVTEAVTGLDLVAWQLRVAAGEALPLEQHQISIRGHAIEARLYAESPARGFLPQTGTVIAWLPAEGAGVRVDHGLRAGQSIGSDYDPMLAKVIAHGASREEARRRLVVALEDSTLLGVETNRDFLAAVLSHPDFAAGRATTDLVGRCFPPGSAGLASRRPDRDTIALAAALLFEAGARPAGPALGAWRSTGEPSWPMRLEIGEVDYALTITCRSMDRFVVELPGDSIEIEIVERAPSAVRFLAGGMIRTARYAHHASELHFDCAGIVVRARDRLREPRRSGDDNADAHMFAPMSGRILAVLAQAGDAVTKGQRLVVLESMKMQHEIVAHRAGIVERVAVKPGDQVAPRQLLAALAIESAGS